MLSVQNQFFVDVKINGTTLPLQQNGFSEITTHENSTNLVPTCKMVIYDTTNTMGNINSIQDGTPITITMGRSTSSDVNFQTGNFRSFGAPKQTSVGSRGAFTITGVMDCMKFWRGQPSGFYFGSSADCITNIATTCGLKADTVPTNDKMNWMLCRKSYATLTSFMSAHGYVDDNSIMALGLDLNSILRYRNLTKLVKQAPVYTFGDKNQSTDSRILTVDAVSRAGLFNNVFAYGMTSTQEKMDGSASVYTKSNITMLSNNLSINSDVKSQVGTVRNEWQPADQGNTHEMFKAAEYQNKRGLATFILSVRPVVGLVTGLNMFDPVTIAFSPQNQVSSMGQNFNGKAFISAKIRTVRDMQYFEKFDLMSQGTNQPDPSLVS